MSKAPHRFGGVRATAVDGIAVVILVAVATRTTEKVFLVEVAVESLLNLLFHIHFYGPESMLALVRAPPVDGLEAKRR